MKNNSFLPLSADQLKLLNELAATLSHEQANWLSGYFTGLLAQGPEAIPVETQPEKPSTHTPPATLDPTENKTRLTILYGSRTGNGEGIARQAEKNAVALGIDVKLKSMETYKTTDLKSESNLLVIISTHGEGEPPTQARAFYDFLFSKRAPQLEGLNFSVLALGDSSYVRFCQTGIEFDCRFEELGAKRIFPRVDCDVNFRVPAFQWLSDAMNVMKSGGEPPKQAAVAASPASESRTALFTKSNPFDAQVLEKVFLHGRNSKRQTLHVELSLENSGLAYEPGDSLGVYASNPPELVENVINTLGLSPGNTVETENGSATLHETLFRKYELTQLTPDVLNRFAQLTGNGKLKKVLQSPDTVKEFIRGKDLIDLFAAFPEKLSPNQLVELLRPIQPRLYSIASSQQAYPDEVHLAVGVVKYKDEKRIKTGLCSVFLSDRMQENESVPVFVEKNNNFRLPPDPATPIIMVGAGTGIAPYRAFVQQRELDDKRGKSWLVFGNRHSESEFLYQLEWQRHLREGSLTRMDVAFSRDTEEKTYVQHRLQEQGKQLYHWLENGAHFYVCGDMKKMARDVHATLVEVVGKQGGLNPEAAGEYVLKLQQQKRYQTDVY